MRYSIIPYSVQEYKYIHQNEEVIKSTLQIIENNNSSNFTLPKKPSHKKPKTRKNLVKCEGSIDLFVGYILHSRNLSSTFVTRNHDRRVQPRFIFTQRPKQKQEQNKLHQRLLRSHKQTELNEVKVGVRLSDLQRTSTCTLTPLSLSNLL